LKKERKKKKKGPEGFFPGQVHPIGCAMPTFSGALGAIESYFKG
jgi:hypothetical protein